MSDILPSGLDDLEERMGSLVGKAGRFLLLIGDEGAIFGRLSGAGLAEAWFCPNEKLDEGRALFARMLASRRRTSLLVLADVLEQMYREDNLPKVGPLDRAKLVRRRLDMAYPGDPLKAALPLEAGVGGNGLRILMAVLAESPALAGWSAFLEGLDNPVTGYCLQPLEAVGLLDRLMPDGDAPARHWRALVGLQATGGLRQIVTLDGRLVITRLTQAPLQPSGDAAGLAQIIERELKSSISYLKRLGYSDAERLDLMVLGDEALCAEIGNSELAVTNLFVMTPAQAAQHLGLRGAARSRDGFSDLLLAEWAARKKTPALALPTPRLLERGRLRRLIGVGQVAALAATVGVALFIGAMLSTSVQTSMEEDELSDQLQTASQRRAETQGEVLPLPVADMRRAADVADGWIKERIDLAGLLAALPADAAQRKVTFSTNPDRARADQGTTSLGKLAPARWEMAVSYELGAKTPLEEQVGRIRDLKARLTAAFPNCRVLVSRLPMGLQASQVLEGNLGQVGPPPDRDALLTLLVRKENG
ncbi:MAG TPA: hypothetical protein VM661_09370 [Candidatus Sulfotelmatobacter sp.]|jgi:hypothetical protein|nr:hypothetical protein [Candidatus Sulfotelmatobacter sp.]